VGTTEAATGTEGTTESATGTEGTTEAATGTVEVATDGVTDMLTGTTEEVSVPAIDFTASPKMGKNGCRGFSSLYIQSSPSTPVQIVENLCTKCDSTAD
jgi:hypothetical protein